jgi:hypothetical protein
MQRLTLALGILLLPASGCLDIKVDPDVDLGGSDRAASANTQYTSYGRQLEDVLEQQSTVAEEFGKRDYEELLEELGDWRTAVRNLSSVAHTSENPEKMRRYTDRLLSLIGEMQSSARSRAPQGVQAALDAADPILDKLSRDFRIVEERNSRAQPKRIWHHARAAGV